MGSNFFEKTVNIERNYLQIVCGKNAIKTTSNVIIYSMKFNISLVLLEKKC